MGLQPDGLPTPPQGTDGYTPGPELSARQALRTRAFWLLTAAVTLRVGVFGSLVLHLVPILVWRGLDAQMAANVVGVMALLSIPTRIGLGWVGDRFGKARVISVAVLVGAFSVVLLVLGTQLWHYFLFAAAFAVADGASPLGWALIGDFFGRRSFATVRGNMTLFYPWGMVILPVLVGWAFDRTQSYQIAIWSFVILFALSAGLFSLLRPPLRVDTG
jgi:MFS family permease